MSETTIRQNSLVLYRNRPARVMNLGKRVEIELDNQKTIKTSLKNIYLLHPGPIRSLSELQSQEGEVQEAWELMVGETTTVAELAELAYGEWTPAAIQRLIERPARNRLPHTPPPPVQYCTAPV